MLKTLTVSNFALVDELEIQFGSGLTVITGESGAGKTTFLKLCYAALKPTAGQPKI